MRRGKTSSLHVVAIVAPTRELGGTALCRSSSSSLASSTDAIVLTNGLSGLQSLHLLFSQSCYGCAAAPHAPRTSLLGTRGARPFEEGGSSRGQDCLYGRDRSGGARARAGGQSGVTSACESDYGRRWERCEIRAGRTFACSWNASEIVCRAPLHTAYSAVFGAETAAVGVGGMRIVGVGVDGAETQRQCDVRLRALLQSHIVFRQFEISPFSPQARHIQRMRSDSGSMKLSISPGQGLRPGRRRQRTPSGSSGSTLVTAATIAPRWSTNLRAGPSSAGCSRPSCKKCVRSVTRCQP